MSVGTNYVKYVAGLPVDHILAGGCNTDWTRETPTIRKFLIEDAKFCDWKRQNHNDVTVTKLKTFPLDDLRRLINAGGLEGRSNINGDLILPLLDEKIRTKITQVWKTLTIEEQYSTGGPVAGLPPPKLPLLQQKRYPLQSTQKPQSCHPVVAPKLLKQRPVSGSLDQPHTPHRSDQITQKEGSGARLASDPCEQYRDPQSTYQAPNQKPLSGSSSASRKASMPLQYAKAEEYLVLGKQSSMRDSFLSQNSPPLALVKSPHDSLISISASQRTKSKPSDSPRRISDQSPYGQMSDSDIEEELQVIDARLEELLLEKPILQQATL